MRDYELVLILPEGEKGNETLNLVKKMVGETEGAVGEVTEWGSKVLAYPIKKQTTGVFYLLKLKLLPAGASNLERQLQVKETLLRHLLVREEKKESKIKSKPKAQTGPKKEVKAEKKSKKIREVKK